MPLSGMLTCGSCGARTQMNTMRYNLGGNKLICTSCVEKERSAIKPGTTHSPVAVRLQKEQMSQKAQQDGSSLNSQASSSGMTNYYCRSCHFKFSRKRDMDIAACPYCGKESVSAAYEGKAQDLIEDSIKNGEDSY